MSLLQVGGDVHPTPASAAVPPPPHPSATGGRDASFHKQSTTPTQNSAPAPGAAMNWPPPTGLHQPSVAAVHQPAAAATGAAHQPTAAVQQPVPASAAAVHQAGAAVHPSAATHHPSAGSPAGHPGAPAGGIRQAAAAHHPTSVGLPANAVAAANVPPQQPAGAAGPPQTPPGPAHPGVAGSLRHQTHSPHHMNSAAHHPIVMPHRQSPTLPGQQPLPSAPGAAAQQSHVPTVHKQSAAHPHNMVNGLNQASIPHSNTATQQKTPTSEAPRHMGGSIPTSQQGHYNKMLHKNSGEPSKQTHSVDSQNSSPYSPYHFPSPAPTIQSVAKTSSIAPSTENHKKSQDKSRTPTPVSMEQKEQIPLADGQKSRSPVDDAAESLLSLGSSFPSGSHYTYPTSSAGLHSGRTHRPPGTLPSINFLSKTSGLDVLKEMPASAKDSTIYGAPGASIPPKTSLAMTASQLSSTAKPGGRTLFPLPSQSAMSLALKPKEDPEKHMTPEQKKHRKFLSDNQKVEVPQCGCLGKC